MTKKIVQVVNEFDPRLFTSSSISKQGNDHAVGTFMYRKAQANSIKINKEQYIVLKSGEIKNYKEGANEVRGLRSIRKAHNDLSSLIRCNFDSDSKDQVFMTATYQGEMFDAERLQRDSDVFLKKLKRLFKDNPFKYITVAEPTGKGTWHLHIMFKFTHPVFKFYSKKLGKDGKPIPLFTFTHKSIIEAWRNTIKQGGAVRNDPLRSSADDMGAYFGSYFRNLETEAGAKDKDLVADKDGKKYIKGGRLHFYPPYMKFFRCSQSVNRPEKERMTYFDTIGEYGDPVFSKTAEIKEYLLEDGEIIIEKVINTIHKAHFNKNRKKNKKEPEI